MDSMLIVATHTVQACNDKQQVELMLRQLNALSVELGKPVNVVADTGYFSAANVKACVEQNITPLITVEREEHHPDPLARFTAPRR
ncbi:MAG: transposase [Candidatus Nitrotoga sp.]